MSITFPNRNVVKPPWWNYSLTNEFLLTISTTQVTLNAQLPLVFPTSCERLNVTIHSSSKTILDLPSTPITQMLSWIVYSKSFGHCLHCYADDVSSKPQLWSAYIHNSRRERKNKSGMSLGIYGGLGHHRYPGIGSGDVYESWGNSLL